MLKILILRFFKLKIVNRKTAVYYDDTIIKKNYADYFKQNSYVKLIFEPIMWMKEGIVGIHCRPITIFVKE